MKTHLFRPGEQNTMCGRTVPSLSIRNPKKITCKHCIRMYEGNEKWYAHAMASLSGPSGQWDTEEQALFYPSSIQFLNLPFDWRPQVTEWAYH